MKTMTCKQMGGPCDVAFHGNTADEVIKAEDKHLKEMVANGDETHKDALKMMQGRWKTPYEEWAGTSKQRRILLLFPKTDRHRNGVTETKYGWMSQGAFGMQFKS